MIELKDIAGLGEPLKRLIEVIAEGIGGLSRPLLTGINADAKAYEMRTIAQAISDSQKLIGPVKYEDGIISIEAPANKEQPALPEATLDQRIKARITFQEVKKQSNLEQVIQHAAEELRDEQKINSERPESNWTTRFFRIAEDITSDQMQILWGKVLAGEVKKPGSYSLRALELLKNITQKEAELFERVGQISFANANGEKAIILNSDGGKYIEDNFGLSFYDFMLLREINLLAQTDISFSIGLADKNYRPVLICGNTAIFINMPKGTPEQKIRAISFTRVGRQLLQLGEKKPVDPKYIIYFASFFRQEGATIQSGLIVEILGNKIRYNNLQDVPTSSE